MLLTRFWPILSFYTPWKHQKTFSFLVFSRGLKWEHGPEICWIILKCFFKPLRGHSCSACAKFSKKLTFLTPWYAHVYVRFRGKKCFGKFCVRTNWIIPKLIIQNLIGNKIIHILLNWFTDIFWKRIFNYRDRDFLSVYCQSLAGYSGKCIYHF